MFKQYRLKEFPAVEVAVCRITRENIRRLALFCGGLEVQTIPDNGLVKLELPTKKGYVRAIEGEYIIVKHRPNPSVEVVSGAVFRTKYEPVPVRRTVENPRSIPHQLGTSDRRPEVSET